MGQLIAGQHVIRQGDPFEVPDAAWLSYELRTSCCPLALLLGHSNN